MFIAITHEPIDETQIKARMHHGGNVGAIVSFSGVVRGAQGDTLELEHYPGMTEKMLSQIATEATARFELMDVAIVHRVGIIKAQEEIVRVIASAQHRQAAFDGANFMMDYLKTRAPFWKKETDGNWVDARESDEDALAKWG